MRSMSRRPERNQRALSADMSGSSTIFSVASTISAARSRLAAASVTKATRTSASEARSARRLRSPARSPCPDGTARGWCGGPEWPRTGRSLARRWPQARSRSPDRRRAGRERRAARRRLDGEPRGHRRGGDRQVLDRRAEAEMHLAAKGIERPEVAPPVGEHLDSACADHEEPWLGVVRIGREEAARTGRRGLPRGRPSQSRQG